MSCVYAQTLHISTQQNQQPQVISESYWKYNKASRKCS